MAAAAPLDRPYLSSVTALLRCSVDRALSPLAATVPLPRRAAAAAATDPHRRRLLACHDMMGGYTVEDAHPNGAHGGARAGTAFTLHYVAPLVDAFVYFAHHRVSLPPPQWTNLAHRAGTLALGTIIFEWAESVPDLLVFMYGEREGTVWLNEYRSAVTIAQLQTPPGAPLQVTPPPMPRVCFSACDKLVELAKALGIDGYLLNVETHLPGGAAQARDLLHLAAYLNVRLNEALGPHAQLLWYDSVVISTGRLAWQDKLCDLNAPYLEATSGLFVNYTWAPTDVAVSAARARTTGRPLRDVYTGIDVFGRNMLGGGGVDGCRLAQQVITWAGTSTALFAPGWVYENGVDVDPATDRRDGWWHVERELWTRLAHEFPVHERRRWCVTDDRDEWWTDFTGASGDVFACDGEIISRVPWCNHSIQSPLPLLANGVDLDRNAPFFAGASLACDAGSEVHFPFHPVRIHADTVAWLVLRAPEPVNSGPVIRISVAVYDAHAGGQRMLHFEVHASDGRSIGSAGWRLFPIDLHAGMSSDAGGVPPRRLLLSLTIHLSSHNTAPVHLGQLALHRTSLQVPCSELTASLSDLLEHPTWVRDTRAKLPPGTPMLVQREHERELVRVMVQGDPWDEAHADEVVEKWVGVENRVDQVHVTWWPFWRAWAAETAS